jgi:hypothetical protein
MTTWALVCSTKRVANSQVSTKIYHANSAFTRSRMDGNRNEYLGGVERAIRGIMESFKQQAQYLRLGYLE